MQESYAVYIIHCFQIFDFTISGHWWSWRMRQGRALVTFIMSVLGSQLFLPRGGLYLIVNSDKGRLGVGRGGEAYSYQGTCDFFSVLFS